jgi:hypothetical protein
MARRLPPGCVSDAVQIARAMRTPSLKCRTLMELTLAAPAADKPALLAEAEAAIANIAEPTDRVAPLASLAGYLSGEASALAARRALLQAPSLRDDYERGWMIVSLAGYLPSEARLEALADMRAIDDDGARAGALAELARFLPEPLEDQVVHEALATARAISDDETRSRTLAGMLERLPEQERQGAAIEALTAAAQTSEALPWARTLRGAAPWLPPDEQARAQEHAQTLRNVDAKAEALTALLPVAAENDRAAVAAAALDAATRVRDEWTRATLISRLAGLLPQELLPQALAAARLLSDPWARADLLGDLAVALPQAERPPVLAEALEAARAAPSPWVRARALTGVAASLASKP